MNDKTLNEQIFASIMHGCPELSKGALGQNAQLPNQNLHFQRCTHGFIEYCLLREDTNLHIGPLQLPMLNVWIIFFLPQVCMVALSSVKVLWDKILSYTNQSLDIVCSYSKVTKVYSKVLLMKSSGSNFILFTYILPDYVGH